MALEDLLGDVDTYLDDDDDDENGDILGSPEDVYPWEVSIEFENIIGQHVHIPATALDFPHSLVDPYSLQIKNLAEAKVDAYLGGLLWNLQTYQDGTCSDFRFVAVTFFNQ
jgi:hypothetical protein